MADKPTASIPTSSVEVQRRNGVKAIKAAQRHLGLDDATYRTMLVTITGKTSATELSLPQIGKVLDHLNRAGGGASKSRTRAAGIKRPVPARDRAALMAEVHAWLDELDRIVGKEHTLRYADAIARRNGWGDTVDLVAAQDLHKLVGALATTARYKARQAQEHLQRSAQGV
jgi:phage gp16-like protein